MSAFFKNETSTNFSKNPVKRRQLLRGVLAAAILGPMGGSLASCAMGGGSSTDNTSGAGARSATNPFGASPSAPLEVVIFDGGAGRAFVPALNGLYNKVCPESNVTVSYTQQIQETMQPRFLAGTPPEIINSAGAHMLDLNALISSDALANLTELLETPSVDDENKKLKDLLVPGAEEIGTYNGKFMALNYQYTTYGLWYSQKLFRDHGWTLPKTFEEFKALCGKIETAGIAPLTYAGRYPFYVNYLLFGLIYNAGGQGLVDNLNTLAKESWTNPATLAAARALQEIVDHRWILAGSAGLSHTESQQQWLDGKAAMIPNGGWVENEMKTTLPADFEMALMPIPSVSRSDKGAYGSVQAAAANSFLIPAAAKNVAGAKEYFRQMLSKEGAGAFTKETNSLTILADAPLPDQVASGLKSQSNVVKQAGNNVFACLLDTRYPKLWNSLNDNLGQLMTGQIAAQAFTENMQKAADETSFDPSITKYND